MRVAAAAVGLWACVSVAPAAQAPSVRDLVRTVRPDPVRQMDVYQRWVDWLQRFL